MLWQFSGRSWYSRPSVELFLNLAWLATSIALITCWIWSTCKGKIQFQWTTFIALALLLVLLFPVISMTDDRVAMTAPIELEHTLRYSEAPFSHAVVFGLFGLFAAIVLVILNMAALRFYSRVRTRVFAEALLAGFIRAIGVRPPPAAAFAFC